MELLASLALRWSERRSQAPPLQQPPVLLLTLKSLCLPSESWARSLGTAFSSFFLNLEVLLVVSLPLGLLEAPGGQSLSPRGGSPCQRIQRAEPTGPMWGTLAYQAPQCSFGILRTARAASRLPLVVEARLGRVRKGILPCSSPNFPAGITIRDQKMRHYCHLFHSSPTIHPLPQTSICPVVSRERKIRNSRKASHQWHRPCYLMTSLRWYPSVFKSYLARYLCTSSNKRHLIGNYTNDTIVDGTVY